MKQLPILFSTPMVKAIGDDRKTQTRRTRGLDKINEAPDDWSLCTCGNIVIDKKKTEFGALFQHNKTMEVLFIKSPYGQPDDLLWVRETWFVFKTDPDDGVSRWEPSIHMPKAAARYWLKVKSVLPERIQDITEEDAKNEGAVMMRIDDLGNTFKSYRRGFESLWITINGEESWKRNDWVWRVEFERTQKP